MNKRSAFWTLALGLAAPLGAQEQMTLEQAVELAQKRGYQSTAAVATRDAARARDRAFGARNRPQLSLTGEAPRYERSILPVIQPDGSTIFTPIQQTTANAGLTVAQRLPFTGGVLSMTSALQRYQRTGGTQQTLSWSSTPVTFELQQPIMRANVLRWESREQDVLIDAAERQYLEAREAIAMRTSGVFFDLYVARRTRENAVKNAAQNDTLYTLNKGRFEVGKIGENDLLQSELALLRSRSQLDNATLDYERALAAFRLAINAPPGTAIEVVPPAAVPQIAADTTVAVAQALRNRAQITELELQAVRARRGIAEARLNNGMGATVNASIGFNQTASDVNLAYQDLLQAQRLRLFVSVPVIQWGTRSSEIQAARADQRRVEASSRATREEIAQEAYFAALGLSQAQRNLAVSAKADTVAAKRFEVAYNRYVIGRIGIDNLYIAQNEKDQAVTQYMQALKSYWAAYYRLRQVTLYDFESNAPIR
jgi:outer membrane protein